MALMELQAEDSLRVVPQLAFDALDLDVDTHGRAGLLGEGRSRRDGGDEDPVSHCGTGEVELNFPAEHEDLEPLPRRVGPPAHGTPACERLKILPRSLPMNGVGSLLAVTRLHTDEQASDEGDPSEEENG
jgi:hypothetical protein